jgi:hypothetical protein
MTLLSILGWLASCVLQCDLAVEIYKSELGTYLLIRAARLSKVTVPLDIVDRMFDVKM